MTATSQEYQFEHTKREIVNQWAYTYTLIKLIKEQNWSPPASANLDLIPGMTRRLKSTLQAKAGIQPA